MDSLSTPLDTTEKAGRLRISSIARAWGRQPEAGVVPVAVVVFVILSFASPVFLTQAVWGSIMQIVAELGVVAIPVTLLMISGDFDLSVGSVFGLSAALVPFLAGHGWGTWGAVFGTLAACVVIGLINAYLVVHRRLPSLIVTIGALMFYQGITLHVTGGNIIGLSPQNTAALGVFNHTYGGFTVSAAWFVGIAVVAAFVLGWTQMGNWIFAVGGGRSAARTSGIKVNGVRTGLFVATSLGAGLGGIMQVSRLVTVDASRGLGLELQAILAAVVGGSSLFGGAGGVIGTAFGVLILGMAEIGLVLLSVPAYWYQTGVGLFLVVTVATNEGVRERVRNRG